MDLNSFTYLSYAHGAYNSAVLLAILYQALLGIKIRIYRTRGNVASVAAIKRHRELGPVLSFAGVAGVLSGLMAVYITTGKILVFRLHLVVALIITALIVVVYLTSRKIRLHEQTWRTVHFAAAIMLLCAYLFQMLLGVDILY